jgi:hypothetical protein
VLAPKLVYGANCLDVGCGTGYISAVMAYLVQTKRDVRASSSSSSDDITLTSKTPPQAAEQTYEHINEDDDDRFSGERYRPGYVRGVDIVKEAVEHSLQVVKVSYPSLSCDFICNNGWITSPDDDDEETCKLAPMPQQENNKLSGATQLFDVIHVGAEGISFSISASVHNQL